MAEENKENFFFSLLKTMKTIHLKKPAIVARRMKHFIRSAEYFGESVDLSNASFDIIGSLYDVHVQFFSSPKNVRSRKHVAEFF